MAGFNPYNNMTWTPQYTAQPYSYPQPGATYSGNGSHTRPPAPNTNNLIRVTGPESAKAYPLGPNSVVLLLDGNDPVFYIKTTDDGGFASMRTFDFTERVPEVVDVKGELSEIDTSGFATKDDLETLNKKLDGIADVLKGLVS